MRKILFATAIILFSRFPCFAGVATTRPVGWPADAACVMCMARDAATGDLWAGTERAGVLQKTSGGWRQFTRADGLGDDDVYAIAVDLLGRVWAGHLNHGVSVYDGKTWTNFDDTRGPRGARVFAIAVCPAGPTAGDVWIASDAGLARYSADGKWSNFTRADGLPSDQVNCLAFDGGTLLAGTQCEGLAIASPKDNYSAWTQVPGPDRPTDTYTGSGLPSCMIDAILVQQNGTIRIGTPWGMATSKDHGASFSYVRGKDAEGKLRDRAAPPADIPEAPNDLLLEDYIETLAEDGAGRLWIGYRRRGFEVRSPDDKVVAAACDAPDPSQPIIPPNEGKLISAIVPLPDGNADIGTYGDGAFQLEKPLAASRAAPSTAPSFVAGFTFTGNPATSHPAAAIHSSPVRPAAPPTAARINQLLQDVASGNNAPLQGEYIGEDWTTGGDDTGRYGRDRYFIFPEFNGGSASDFPITVRIGSHHTFGGPYSYYQTTNIHERQVLWIADRNKRMQAEYNDGTFSWKGYPTLDTWEGPDLWIDFQVPAGVYRVSVYFINRGAYNLKNIEDRNRDFLVELKSHADPTAMDAVPALARTRVINFREGVYKQFLVHGTGSYSLKIGRNFSYCTKASAIFIDRVDVPPTNDAADAPQVSGTPVLPPPLTTQPSDLNVAKNPTLKGAIDLQTALDQRWDQQEAASLQRTYRLLALSMARDGQAPADLLDRWRFMLPLMNDADHHAFELMTGEETGP